MLIKYPRRSFCSGTPYHHDFHIGNFNKTKTDFALALFEFGRIFFYVYFTFKIAINLCMNNNKRNQIFFYFLPRILRRKIEEITLLKITRCSQMLKFS